MLEVAKTKIGTAELIRFDVVDATDLQIEDSSFDTVVCRFGVTFLPDKVLSYREVRRVLKLCGSYIFNVWDSWTENPWQIVHEAVEALFPDDLPGFCKVPFGYHDAEEICESLARAGFDEESVERAPINSQIIASRFARGLIYVNPIYEEIATRGGDPNAVLKTVTEANDSKLGKQMPLQAIVVSASIR